MSSTKESLQQARELITQKRYDEARSILVRLNHPTAEQWLAKLDEIAPSPRVITRAPTVSTENNQSEMMFFALRRDYLMVGGIAGVVCLFIGLIIGILIGRSSLGSATSTALPTTVPVIQAEPTEVECWSDTWWDEASPIVVSFLDTTEVAGATARISVSDLAIDLRRFQREFDEVEFPECVEPIQSNLSSGMSYIIDGMQDFMSDEDSFIVVDQINDGSDEFSDAYDALQELGLNADRRLADLESWFWE